MAFTSSKALTGVPAAEAAAAAARCRMGCSAYLSCCNWRLEKQQHSPHLLAGEPQQDSCSQREEGDTAVLQYMGGDLQPLAAVGDAANQLYDFPPAVVAAPVVTAAAGADSVSVAFDEGPVAPVATTAAATPCKHGGSSGALVYPRSSCGGELLPAPVDKGIDIVPLQSAAGPSASSSAAPAVTAAAAAAAAAPGVAVGPLEKQEGPLGGPVLPRGDWLHAPPPDVPVMSAAMGRI